MSIFSGTPGVTTSFVDGGAVSHNLPPIAGEPPDVAPVEPAPAGTDPARTGTTRQEPERAASQRVMTPAARARAGELLRNVGKQVQQVEPDLVPEDPSDEFSPLVERSLVGNTGAQLARANTESIDAEIAELAREGEASLLDHAEEQGGQAEEGRSTPAAAPADQLTVQQRVAQWKKKAELLDALFEGADLTEEMCRRFIVPFKENGRIVRESVYDSVRGRMRAGDYTRGKQQLAEIKRQYGQAEAGMVQIVGALTGGDPVQFRQAIEFLPGALETFFKACVVQGFQWDAERRMTAQERALVNQNRQLLLDKQRHELELTAARNQSAQLPSQPTVDERQAFFEQELTKLLPIAADRLMKRGTPYVNSKFTRMLWEPTWRSFLQTWDGNLTVDDVTDQLISIMEQTAEHERAGGIVHTPRAATELPPVSRTSPAPAAQLNTQNTAAQAGAPSYASPNGAPQRGRIGELTQQVNRAYR
jgi:hypothetical protein